MRRAIRIGLILLLFPMMLSTVAGWMGAPGFLHPEKRALTPDMVRDAEVTFGQIGAHREEFDVRAPDGAMHTGALGTASEEFRWRVVQFFDRQSQKETGGASREIRMPG